MTMFAVTTFQDCLMYFLVFVVAPYITFRLEQAKNKSKERDVKLDKIKQDGEATAKVVESVKTDVAKNTEVTTATAKTVDVVVGKVDTIHDLTNSMAAEAREKAAIEADKLRTQTAAASKAEGKLEERAEERARVDAKDGDVRVPTVAPTPTDVKTLRAAIVAAPDMIADKVADKLKEKG